MKSKEFIKEEATCGSTGSTVIAATVETLGEKGNFSKADMHKRLSGYTNQLSTGGIVKGVKQSKVK
jgi:hypothetical protein